MFRLNNTLFSFMIIILLFAFGRIALAFNAVESKPEQVTHKSSPISPKNPKTLRVLAWSGYEHYLTKAGSPVQLEQQYIEQFAKQKNWQIEYVYKEKFTDLIPALKADEGDVIVSNLTITSDRQKHVAFTQPIVETTEFLVMGKNGVDMVNSDDLAKRAIAVQPGTSYAVTAIDLEKIHPDLEIVAPPEKLTYQDTFDKVANADYDVTIVDDNILASTLMYRSDLKKSIQANKLRFIGWAVAKHNHPLKIALNQFLVQQNITVKHKIPNKNEWDLINERGTIRFVMRNNIASYYLWKGQLMGFHYELARDFAKTYNLKYEILVAPDNESLFTYIKDGKADIALGFYTTNEQHKKQDLEFSHPHYYLTEQSLPNEQEEIPEIVLIPDREVFDSAILIDNAADNHLTNLNLSLGDDIKPKIKQDQEKAQSWVIKSGNNSLLERVEQYAQQSYRGLFYNVIHKHYFENEHMLKKVQQCYTEQKAADSLSPYDEVVEKYARQYGFDSKLLIAQMHQESSFNPEAISFAGAVGLFQIMPNTAKQLKMTNLTVPENSIQAGVRYLHWVQERMKEQNVREDQLIWFALASYNAGSGHVTDAIRLAKTKGWQGDVWFDNVEKAMLLLSQQEYSSKARYGYVRGKEPVDYVRKIRNKYHIYNQQSEPQLSLQITSP